MKTVFLRQPAVILIGLLATMGLSSIHAAEPVTLRVLCYNIHYGQGNDGQYDLPRLAEVISSLKPDLVALQEVDVGVERSGRVHQARELGRLTGLSVRYGPTQHYQGGLYGNAVLSRLPIQDVHIQPLPYTAATPKLTTYPRGAIAVTVALPDGRPLMFVSTHFQHNVEADRVAEADAINSYFGESDGMAILAGDMNAVPDAEPIQIIERKWMHTMDAARLPTAPAEQPRSRIDYVFFRGDRLKVIQSEVIEQTTASDHRPMFVVFEVKE